MGSRCTLSIPGYTLHSVIDGRRVKRLFPSLPCLFYTPCGPSLSNCHTLLVCLPSLQRTSFTRTQRGWLSRSLCSWNLAEPLVYSTCSVNKTKWDLTRGRVWIWGCGLVWGVNLASHWDWSQAVSMLAVAAAAPRKSTELGC